MGISYTDLLVLAKKMAEENDETAWRSSISRAYYAAYHHNNEWHSSLKAPGSNIGPEGGVHQQLINRLRNPAPEIKGDERKISKLKAVALELLRNQRHKADYGLDLTCNKIEACQACENAEKLLT